MAVVFVLGGEAECPRSAGSAGTSTLSVLLVLKEIEATNNFSLQREGQTSLLSSSLSFDTEENNV